MVVDGYQLWVAGMVALIGAEDGFEVATCATSVAELEALGRDSLPDVVVLGPNTETLEEIGGQTALIRRVLELSPESLVLVVCRSAQETRGLSEGLEAGAVSALTMAASGEEFLEALRTTLLGGSFLPSDLALKLIRDNVVEAGPRLSERDAEILTGVAFGHTNLEMADRLGLSVRTIETRRARIQDRLGLRGRSEMVGYASDKGMMDAPGGWHPEN
jgi:two-component system response regulator NreC